MKFFTSVLWVFSSGQYFTNGIVKSTLEERRIQLNVKYEYSGWPGSKRLPISLLTKGKYRKF